MIFDSLSYVKILKETGFNQDQSEALISIWTNVMKEELATKNDISALKQDIKMVKKDLELLEKHMTIKMGSMITAAVVLIVTLQKLL